jgi:pimeloyl-ACP methyl ester carboxylesterase
MLFLHGVTRDHRDWQGVMPAFQEQWQVIGLDMRGHGKSARVPGQYFVTDYVEDVVAFVEEVFVGPGVLFGHSLGAMVACSVAARCPQQVKAVVLEDPPYNTLGSRIGATPFAAYFAALRDLLACPHESAEQLAVELAEVPMGLPDGRGTVRLGEVRDAASLLHHAQSLICLDADALVPIVGGRWLDGYDWKSELDSVSCSVLLLKGDLARGGMLPNDISDELTSGVANCTLVDFPNVGHHIHATQTETVIETVTRFLERAHG